MGAKDTPYAYGAFLYDMHMDHTFPQKSPKCNLMTNGNGQVRFNPNLYANGKVCLSILGTWAGPGWKSDQSSLYQVLVSIQTLVMHNDIYFNEPGWAS